VALTTRVLHRVNDLRMLSIVWHVESNHLLVRDRLILRPVVGGAVNVNRDQLSCLRNHDSSPDIEVRSHRYSRVRCTQPKSGTALGLCIMVPTAKRSATGYDSA